MPLRFAHPEPPRPGARPRVYPVFLPQAGCPGRCIYCNQPAQTGQRPEALETLLARARAGALALPADAGPVELAFYGGTFTALPPPWPERLLGLAAELRGLGRVSRVRCSTRPDAVSPELLSHLRGLGLDLVELGVQSFQDAALARSRRGYDGALALAACRMVRQASLSLGVQLLPGLPGHSAQDLARDIETIAALAPEHSPELVRLYPCLVLEGTELAGMWRSGAYAPWGLPETVDALARALLRLWAAGIPAARLGLAEEQGLGVLAGPRHPALGQMARARALFLHVRELLAALPEPATTLSVPRRWQGEVLGQGNALREDYAALGLGVSVWAEAEFALG
ncbi:MAG: radical SAM protein [Proteobacteria bacterium]|nr:radical SAM protein [Pseudomonadota bacterium]MBU1596584.1 radical SAM protein [Pseudomonadota bacterium]